MLEILLRFWESSGFSQIFAFDTVLFGIPLPGHLIMILIANWAAKKVNDGEGLF